MTVALCQRSVATDLAARLAAAGVTRLAFGSPWYVNDSALPDDRVSDVGTLDEAYGGPAGEALARALAGAASLPDAWRDCVMESWASEVFAPVASGALEAIRAARIASHPAIGVAAGGLRGLGFRAVANPREWLDPEHTRAANARPPAPQLRVAAADVLLVELFAYRLRNLTPVVEGLRARGLRVTLLSLGRSVAEAEAHRAWADEVGATFVPWTSFSATAAGAGARGVAALVPGRRALRDALRGVHPGLAAPKVAREVRRALVRSGTKALFLRAVFTCALRRITPAAVFTCRGDGPTLRALGDACADMDVPVVDVQHGRQDLLPPGCVRNIAAVRFALSSQAAIDAYVHRGVPRERILRVGSAGFDALMRTGRATPADPTPRVVYSCSADGATAVDDWNAMTRAVAGLPSIAETHRGVLVGLDAWLSDAPGVRVVVALHPRQDPRAVADEVAGMTNADRVDVTRGGDNAALFRGALAHISLGSTTAVEAALLGTPAIIVEPPGHSAYFDAAIETGWVQRVASPTALAAALARARAPESDHALVSAYAVSADGRSVERLLETPTIATALARRT